MQPALTGEVRMLETRETRWLQTIGRLREGVTLPESREELRMISSRLAAT